MVPIASGEKGNSIQMRSPERRANARLPVLVDVVIIVGPERHAAELRDVGSDGIGIVLTNDSIRLENGARTIIEFDTSSGWSPLLGTLRVESSPISYRPNI